MTRRTRLRVLIGMAVVPALLAIGQALLTEDASLAGLTPQQARIEKLRRAGNVDALAEELTGSDPAGAVLAAEALGSLGTEATSHLEPAMKDPRPEVREVVALALARAGGPGAIPILSPAVRTDTSPPVRAAAVTALGKLGDPDAMGILLDALGDSNAGVRGRAAEAVSTISGIEFGFRPNDPPARRQQAQRQIRMLWKQFEPAIRDARAREARGI